MNGFRLVLAGRDYPLGSTISGDDFLFAFISEQRISKRRPGVVVCDTCREYSNVWGFRQAGGFRDAHKGHRFRVEVKAGRR